MAQPMPFCWQIRTPQISDLGLIWLDGIGGDARHLLLEDKETGDVLFPLVTLTSRFQRGHRCTYPLPLLSPSASPASPPSPRPPIPFICLTPSLPRIAFSFPPCAPSPCRTQPPHLHLPSPRPPRPHSPFHPSPSPLLPSRKLSSLAYRMVVLPNWPMARAGEGSSRKRKQRGDAEGGPQRKAVEVGGEVTRRGGDAGGESGKGRSGFEREGGQEEKDGEGVSKDNEGKGRQACGSSRGEGEEAGGAGGSAGEVRLQGAGAEGNAVRRSGGESFGTQAKEESRGAGAEEREEEMEEEEEEGGERGGSGAAYDAVAEREELERLRAFGDICWLEWFKAPPNVLHQLAQVTVNAQHIMRPPLGGLAFHQSLPAFSSLPSISPSLLSCPTLAAAAMCVSVCLWMQLCERQQVGDMGGEVSLVPLPVVYNSMARRPGVRVLALGLCRARMLHDARAEHKFFRILYRAIRLTSYYHVLKHPPGMEQALVDHHCPAFPPPLVRTNGTRRCSRCSESPMRGPASLQHTFVKYTLPVHDADNDLLLAYRLLPIARFVPLHACLQRWQQLQHVRTQRSGESEGQEGEEDAVLGIQMSISLTVLSRIFLRAIPTPS
ncbi:unnamed protein product [Closterium sp. NIES-64]|nr:unnamed protein product [Closterium sp. NIES-64]